MTSRLVLFDLNGTLNTSEGLQYYKAQSNKPDTKVGILTANALISAHRFAANHDIEPDIIARGFVKSKELLVIEAQNNADEVQYVGNSITDRTAARIAGWEYVSISDISHLR